MKLKICLLVVVFYLPFHSMAQEDSSKLLCPLNEVLEPPAEKKAYSIGADDLKAAWVSKTDTTVKACIDGVVTVVLHDADGKWEVMFKHDDYTFWYSGLTKLSVVQAQKIKTGDTIGYSKRGDKIILQMMDAETSVDPKEFLDCKR